MNNLKRALPFALAVLLIFLCFSGVELSRSVLPDYKNTPKEFKVSKNLSLSYFDNTSDLELYPMNLYDKSKVKKAENETQFKHTNELIRCLISVFCDDESLLDNLHTFDFNEYLEYQDIEKLSRVYFIKDKKLVIADNTAGAKTYILNAAFTRNDMFCFTLIPEHEENNSSNTLENAYSKLNRDYKEYILNDDSHTRIDGRMYPEEDIDEGETEINESNLFWNFFDRYYKLDNYCESLEMNCCYDIVFNLMSAEYEPQITYNEMMYISFSDKNYRLILTYDPYEPAIVGFNFYSEE